MPASIQVDWTLNSTDEDGVRVYLSDDAGSTWSQVADLAAGTETHTESGLLVGEEYVAEVEAYTADVSSRSSTSDPLLTDLPGIQGLHLDNGVVDEIAVSYDDTINNGQYRVEYRKTNSDDDSQSPDAWQEAAVRAHDARDATHVVISGLLDGEEYEVRARTETDDYGSTGWVTASIVTAFPAVTDLSATVDSETQVTLSWTDNADNELFYEVRRERQVDGEWWPEESVEQLDPGTEQYVDDTVQPDTTYRYHVRGVTSYTFADSDSVEATTTSTGVTRRRIPTDRWVVEAVTPTGNVIRTTRCAGTASWKPGVMQTPEVEIPVPDADRWRSDRGEDPEGWEMRVWYKGDQLPIEELVEVSRSDGVATLRGVGGRALEQYVRSWQVDEEETHVALENLLSQRTEYTLDIADPDATTQEDVTLLEYGTRGLAEEYYADEVDDSTIPIEWVSGGLETVQTCWFTEAEDASGDGVAFASDSDRVGGNPGEYSGGEAVRMASEGDSRSYQFQAGYDTGGLDAALLFAVDGDNPPDLEVSNSENSDVATLPGDVIDNTGGPLDLEWRQLGFGADNLSAGEPVTVTVEVASSGDDVWLDAFAVYDTAYSYTFDETPVDGLIDGPELYPDAVPLEGDDVASVFAIQTATLDVSMDATDGSQALALSGDEGSTWSEGANTASHTADYSSSPVQQVRARVTVSRTGTRTSASPATGFQPQTLSGLEVTADLDDTPILLDRRFEGELADDILTPVAKDAASVWELQRDQSAAFDDTEGNVLRYAARGQRERSSVARVVDVSSSRTIEGAADCVIISGAGQSESEEFLWDDAGGTASLEEDWLVAGKETVYHPDTDEEYERREDYAMDYTEGSITHLEDGAMDASETFAIEYTHKPRGKYPSGVDPEASDVRTVREDAQTATTDLICQQIAVGLYKRIQDPLEEVDIELAASSPTQSFVDALDHDMIPFEDPVVVESPTLESGTWTWTARSRRSASEVMDRLKRTVKELAERS